VDAEFVLEQIEAVMELDISAIKTGLLFRAELIEALGTALQHSNAKLIVDPVLVAGDGRRIVNEAAIQAYKDELLPAAYLVTPNIDEARLLTGQAITDVASMCEAAKILQSIGKVSNVLIKGGHLNNGDAMVDLLFDGSTFHELSADQLSSHNPRGAGDTYASCIAAELAKGQDIVTAAHVAKAYVTAAIRGAVGWRMGQGQRGLLFHGVDRPATKFAG
jgi:hydroxymethylpyrimidine/phosphomethylpyrimidine kinase